MTGRTTLTPSRRPLYPRQHHAQAIPPEAFVLQFHAEPLKVLRRLRRAVPIAPLNSCNSQRLLLPDYTFGIRQYRPYLGNIYREDVDHCENSNGSV